jgi:hypothetical protein
MPRRPRAITPSSRIYFGDGAEPEIAAGGGATTDVGAPVVAEAAAAGAGAPAAGAGAPTAGAGIAAAGAAAGATGVGAADEAEFACDVPLIVRVSPCCACEPGTIEILSTGGGPELKSALSCAVAAPFAGAKTTGVLQDTD